MKEKKPGTLKSESEKVIVALDVRSSPRANELVQMMHGSVAMFKVGSQLYMAAGPSVIRDVIDKGERVFLDLKFYDIPHTVSRAAAEAARLGVSAMTIHASGGRAMMQTVVNDLQDEFGDRRPWIFAVTVLTSIDGRSLAETGVERPPEDQVRLLAHLAEDSGVDGVVCSPWEIKPLRKMLDRRLKIVTPGIRLSGQATDDQKRTSTPNEAIAAGADYIVVGRPVTEARDPREALLRILRSMD